LNLGSPAFKAWSIARAIELKKQLVEKYPEKRERVEYIIDLLINKLRNLRVFTLTDYLATLHHAAKEFREIEQIIPSEQEVEELLKGGE
jgi:DNA gyrase/topoisomerase IV subunit A